ncbi:nucleoside recognition domain-containing protein [Pseudomonas mohnii]
MDVISIILTSGRSAVELALFVLLPVMVIMLSIMRLLEAAGVMDWVVARLAPVLKPLGLTGLSLFALLQVNFVSFAAPLATLTTMERKGASDRHLAATLAMIFAMGQANVVFPLTAIGLKLGEFVILSILGGLIASVATYYVIGRRLSCDGNAVDSPLAHPTIDDPKGILAIINHAGSEAFRISIGAIPLVALSLVAVTIIKDLGVFGWFETLLTPLLNALHIDPILIVPSFTKYLAGGTALLGVMVELQHGGHIDSHLVNLSAGWLVHTLDLVGIAILISAGPRVARVWKPAALGALVGIFARTAGHIILN